MARWRQEDGKVVARGWQGGEKWRRGKEAIGGKEAPKIQKEAARRMNERAR